MTVDIAPPRIPVRTGGTRLRGTWRLARVHGLGVALVVVLGYLTLMPIFRLQQTALSDGGAGYADALDARNLGETIAVTVGLGLGSLVIGVAVGGTLAVTSMRLPVRFRWMSILPILPIVVPPTACMVGWSILLAPNSGLINNWVRSIPGYPGSPDEGPMDVFTVPWIIIITGLGLSSFVYIFLRNGLQRVNAEHVEAARTSGAGRFATYRQIVFPIIRPSVVYGVAVALLLGLGQFAAPLMLGLRDNTRVLSTEVYYFTAQSPSNYPASAAIATPLLFAGLVIVLLQKFLLSDQQRFVVDSGKGGRFGLRPSRAAPFVLLGFAVFATALPILALVLASLSPYWDGSFDLSTMTLDNFSKLSDNLTAMQAIRTSLIASISAVAISVPLGYVISDRLCSESTPRALKSVLDLIVSLPLGIPAVVFGAGFLFTYTQGPFMLYGTNAVLIVVYVTIMLPFATRMQLAARMSLGPHYQAAARVAGAGVIRSHLDVVVPMLRASMAGSAALIFVLLSHEFAASLLVRSTQTQVMGTALFDLWATVSYPLVAAMGLVMCLITAIGVSLALVLGGTKSLEGL